MKSSVKQLNKGFPVDTLLFFVPQDEKLMQKTAWKNLGGTKLMNILAQAKKEENFSGKAGESVVYRGLSGVIDGVSRIVFVGLGKVDKEGLLDAMSKALAKQCYQLPQQHIEKVGVFVDGYAFTEDMAKVAEELTIYSHLGSYRFLTYKTKNLESMKTMKEMVLVSADKKAVSHLKKGAKKSDTIGEYVTMARDLSNEPSHAINPGTMEQKAKALAKRLGLKVKVLNTAEVKKKGMNLLYNVGKAGEEGPRLIVLSYRGNAKSKDVYGMVGKGITYDTGGLSLKPSNYMRSMKTDMTGSATVLGAICAIASLGLKVNVDVYMPMAENAIGETAYKPDDIITAYNGKTVEIENTDAEGRLVLADALSYACESKPKQIIDIGTLTGAALIVTGGMAAPIMGTSQELADDLKAASNATGERVWQLPLWDEAFQYIKSPVADMMNCGRGTHPGTISCASFLQQFVDEKTPWVHIDIAGVTLAEDAVNAYGNGPSGFGVRLLTKWIEAKQ